MPESEIVKAVPPTPDDALIAYQQTCLSNQAQTIFEQRETIARLKAEVAAEHEFGRRMFTDYERLLNAAYDERDRARRQLAECPMCGQQRVAP